MFIMSGDSTKECERYLFAGSIGSSILKLPALFESVPLTVRLPATVAPLSLSCSGVTLPVWSLKRSLPAPSPLPLPVEMRFQLCPPVELFHNLSHVPVVDVLYALKTRSVLLPALTVLAERVPPMVPSPLILKLPDC